MFTQRGLSPHLLALKLDGLYAATVTRFGQRYLLVLYRLCFVLLRQCKTEVGAAKAFLGEANKSVRQSGMICKKRARKQSMEFGRNENQGREKAQSMARIRRLDSRAYLFDVLSRHCTINRNKAQPPNILRLLHFSRPFLTTSILSLLSMSFPVFLHIFFTGTFPDRSQTLSSTPCHRTINGICKSKESCELPTYVCAILELSSSQSAV